MSKNPAVPRVVIEVDAEVPVALISLRFALLCFELSAINKDFH